VLIAVFVYGLIGWNVKVSLSDWRTAEKTSGWAGLDAYRDLNSDPAWDESVHHILVFTGTFIVGTLFFGLLLAFLLEKGVRGEGFFRSVYIFPLAVSFIAAGVVWRWLMNPAPGDRASGLNVAFEKLGLGFLANDWYLSLDWGMAAMAMPAIWALSGYIMALYLAGFRGVPEELREAARMDGAGVARLSARGLSLPSADHAVGADHPRPHLDQGVRPDRRHRRQAVDHANACRLHVDPHL